MTIKIKKENIAKSCVLLCASKKPTPIVTRMKIKIQTLPPLRTNFAMLMVKIPKSGILDVD